MKKLYLIGGGGHCLSCLDVIESTGQFQIIGIFDQKLKTGDKILNYSILGNDENLKKYVVAENFFFITVGQIKSADTRISIFENLKAIGANIVTIISPHAYVSPHANIGEGTIVMHHAVVNAGASVGQNCILNTKSLVEHGSQIGSHCHISTAAVVNGDCIVNEKTFIGSNAVLKEGTIVPSLELVPAGSFYHGK